MPGGSPAVKGGIDLEEQQRHPDAAEADRVRRTERLAEGRHCQQEVQARREVLHHAEGREPQPAHRLPEQQQRDDRNRAANDLGRIGSPAVDGSSGDW